MRARPGQGRARRAGPAIRFGSRQGGYRRSSTPRASPSCPGRRSEGPTATPERPHRMARLIDVPAGGEIVTAGCWRRSRASPTRATGRPSMVMALSRPVRSVKDERPDCRLRKGRSDTWLRSSHRSKARKEATRHVGAVCRVALGFDLTEEEAYRLIDAHYNRRCQPPWTEKELRHKIDDAYKEESAREAGCSDQKPPSGNGHADGKGLPTGGTGKRPQFSNCRVVAIEGGKPGETRNEPRSSEEIAGYLAEITAKTGTWPKRLDEALFVQSADFRPIFLESPTQFFAFIDKIASVFWPGGAAWSLKRGFTSTSASSRPSDSRQSRGSPTSPRCLRRSTCIPRSKRPRRRRTFGSSWTSSSLTATSIERWERPRS